MRQIGRRQYKLTQIKKKRSKTNKIRVRIKHHEQNNKNLRHHSS